MGLLRGAVFCALLASATPGTAAEPPSILVSRQLLDRRALRIGDVLRLSTKPNGSGAQEFRIAGAYEPVPDPLQIGSQHFEARLHLPDLLALQQESDSVETIQVRLTDPRDEATFRQQLAARTPSIAAFSPTDAGRVGTFRVLERFHVAISIVTVLGSTAFLLALMVMRADERRELAGALRLVGFSRRRILLQVLLEGVAVSTAGAVFGVAFAASSQRLVNAIFQARYDTALVFLRITPRIAAVSILVAVPLGILAALVASWALLRRDVVDLLRR